MTAVLLWKEYRQQRAIWLAIAFLAILLVLSLAATMGHSGGLEVFNEEKLRGTLIGVIFVLAISYGVVSGALLLAGESDEKTLTFLDSLTAQRGQLWSRKFLAGVILTISQSLALIGLGLGLGFTPWPVALALPLLALDALAWGLLGGALCQRVMSAVLTGIGFMACTWLIWPIAGGDLWYVVVRLGAAVTAVYVSWRRYSAVDRLRQPLTVQPRQRQFSILPTSVRVLLWLILRQGRWVLGACVLGAILLAATVNLAPTAIWPFGTALMGVACGLSTFTDDQNDGVRFLGAQRFPPGRIWTVKIVFWGAILFLLTAAAWYVSVLALMMVNPDIALFRGSENEYSSTGHWWFERWTHMRQRTELLDPLIFVGMWPLYGFCLGQYFAQVMTRPILAGILAFFVAPLAAVWLPSLLFGGLSLWQVLIVPILLLLLTRLNQRPWLAGRLLSGKPLVLLIAGNLVVTLSLLGSLWYRVVEIPDGGEPFDVVAFTASLPSSEQNKAGTLLRRAGAELREQRDKVEKELQPPTELLFRDENAPKEPVGPPVPGGQPGRPVPPGLSLPQLYSYNVFLSEILEKGWPKHDREMVRWLDRVFEGAWVQDAETTARLPLGMLLDPRYSDGGDVGNIYQDCRSLGTLFTVRAMQVQAQGDRRAALRHLETALALSRQVKNYSIGVVLYEGYGMERSTLTCYRRWLENAPRDKALLQDALIILQQHEAANPTLDNALKAQYLSFRHNDPVFSGYSESVNELLTTAYQVPWEKERQRRLARALVAGQLRASEKPLWENSAWTTQQINKAEIYMREARLIDLPPKEGSGSHLSAATWGELLRQFSLNHPRAGFFIPLMIDSRRKQTLEAAELATAVALYQVDHGAPPETLDALVPDYLPALPINPFTGKSFDYVISKGDKLEKVFPPITLVPGQALVIGNGSDSYFPVPHWSK